MLSCRSTLCAHMRSHIPHTHGLQLPLHSGEFNPSTAPKRPAGQLEQGGAPATALELYMPSAHCAVADTEPGAQVKPAKQFPLHRALVRPLVPPYTPAGHSAHVLRLVAPYTALKVPNGQGTCSGSVLRAGQ